MIEFYKDWLVANGIRQIQGTDYQHTFSPVVKANSVTVAV